MNPQANPRNCLCARTRRAARRLTLLYEESLRPAGLTAAQFELMGELQQSSSLTQTALAEHLVLDQTTLSRNLRLLIERGWIIGTPSPTDRRKIGYTLTAEGKNAWSNALPLWQAAQRQTEQRLGSDLPAAWTVLDRLAEDTPKEDTP